jgi:hypothetical protein
MLNEYKEKIKQNRENKKDKKIKTFLDIMYQNNIDITEVEKIVITKTKKAHFDMFAEDNVFNTKLILQEKEEEIKFCGCEIITQMLSEDENFLEDIGVKVKLYKEVAKKVPLKTKIMMQKRVWDEYRTKYTWEIDCTGIK